jgi:hypothetical protein
MPSGYGGGSPNVSRIFITSFGLASNPSSDGLGILIDIDHMHLMIPLGMVSLVNT